MSENRVGGEAYDRAWPERGAADDVVTIGCARRTVAASASSSDLCVHPESARCARRGEGTWCIAHWLHELCVPPAQDRHPRSSYTGARDGGAHGLPPTTGHAELTMNR